MLMVVMVLNIKSIASTKLPIHNITIMISVIVLDLFKACGGNAMIQITKMFGHFLKRVEIFPVKTVWATYYLDFGQLYTQT